MKKNYLKKLLPVVTMLLCSVVASAHDFEVDGIYYNISSDEVEVTFMGDNSSYYDNEYSGNVVIPETVTYNGITYSVTSIGNGVFHHCIYLTSVTIGNSVTSIGDDAFYGCSKLSSITIPNSVVSIGNDAFYNTVWYDNQPNGVVYAGKVLYQYKGRMPSGTSINIKEGTLGITGNAFYDCTGLTSVTIGNSVTSIGRDAFHGCTGLTSITIPNSVTSIGRDAFHGCSGLTSITIPNSVTSIGGSAFSYCSGLTSIVVENGNTVYDSRNNCNAIIETKTNTLISGCKNTIIPNSVTSIESSAFSGCSGLTSITIPNSVTSIGDRAFPDCRGLTSIVVEDGNTVYDSRNNCNAIIETKTNALILGCKNTIIPEDVTSIEGHAFYGCHRLTSITIPNSVTSIGSGAFSYCSGLTSITIPNSVTSIGSRAFYSTNLKTVINFSNLKFEKDSYWDDNGGIAYYADKLINAPNGYLEGDFCFSKIDGINTLCGYIGDATRITLPTNHKGENYAIGDYAFSDCTGLTSITIPNSVTSIENYAFRDCSGLKKVIIGNSVTSIEESAFEGCDNIFRLLWLCKTPPEGYKNLKASMNYVANDEFTGLKNMVVVPYISSAFEVDDVMYVPTNPQKRTCDIIDYSGTNDTIIIGERVNYKGVEMTVENIMPYSFYNSGAIDYLSINCNTIGENCFVSSTDIKTIILGEKLSSIGDNLFSTCNKLQKIYCNATVPPTCGKNVFKDVDKWNCELYVPAESMADYQTADVWNEFFLINEIPTGIEDVAEEVAPAFEVTDGGIQFTDAEGKAVVVYSTAGAVLEKIDSYAGEEITLDKGVYIVRVGNKTVKVSL